MPERYPPEDPREWLNRAKSNLLLASARKEREFIWRTCVLTRSRRRKKPLKLF